MSSSSDIGINGNASFENNSAGKEGGKKVHAPYVVGKHVSLN